MDVLEKQKKVVDKIKELRKSMEGSHDIDNKEKINPLVVALLVGPDNEEIFSYRSECFDGDHAEYNLFMNKLKGTNHSNDILFVSLEPCNHNSRINTISCSELIVKSNIKKVYMGTFDPDILVRGNGYAYLKEHGVEVELFDEKYQKELIDENWPFFKDKMYCNEDSRRFLMTYKNSLSKEAIAYYLDSISNDEFEGFDKKRINDIIKDEEKLFNEFYDIIVEKNYIFKEIRNGKRVVSSNEGFDLAFFEKPTSKYKGAIIKIVDESSSREFPSKVFDGPLIISFSKSINFINNRIDRLTRNSIKIKGVIRELLANAVFHKDYCSYSPIIVKIFNDKIAITNPCKTKYVDIDYLNKYDMPTNPVNGCLSDIALDMKLMEGQGRGESTLKEMKLDNPYELICNILRVTIPLNNYEKR